MSVFKDFVAFWNVEATLPDNMRDRVRKTIVYNGLFFVYIAAIVLPGLHLHGTLGLLLLYPAYVAVVILLYHLLVWRRLKKLDLPESFLRLWKLRALIFGPASVVLITTTAYLYFRWRT